MFSEKEPAATEFLRAFLSLTEGFLTPTACILLRFFCKTDPPDFCDLVCKKCMKFSRRARISKNWF